MNLKIKTGTVVYNNKILVSDEKFSLGENIEVNSLVLEEPVIPMPKDHPSHKVLEQINEVPTIAHKKQEPQTITHEEEKTAWFFLWLEYLRYGTCFND